MAVPELTVDVQVDGDGSAAAPDVKPAPVRKPAEEWARAKGHAKASRQGRATVMAPELDWRFAAAKAHENWPQGVELTEADYDRAVQAATSVTLR
jgi:hypothetical protein